MIKNKKGNKKWHFVKHRKLQNAYKLRSTEFKTKNRIKLTQKTRIFYLKYLF